VIPEHQWNAFLADREGAVVGRGTADRFDWKIGDRIPIQAPIWGGTWEFNIRAIYEGSRGGDDESQLWFQGKYLEERRPWGEGTVGWYTVRVDDADNAATVIQAVDDQFANSAWETSTETEAAFASGFAKQIGNIRMLMMSIGSVVLFTLLLVTGNTMAMAVRERVPELGVLKTLGFGDRTVLMMVLAESLVLTFVGGVLGLGLAKLTDLTGDPIRGILPLFHLSSGAIAVGAVIALVVGLAAGSIPALTAMNLRIVDALRRI
jgi:putative ABC transport system permease protein